MDKKFFFATVKPLFVSFTQEQVDGLDFILNEWEASGLTDKRWLAYMLSTSFHETAHTMCPVREYGRGKGRRYGQKLKMSGVPYTEPDQLYYGRGFVQLTWYENYATFEKLLKVPLLKNPDLALQPDIASRIMFVGMSRGLFSGKKLSDYFNATTTDWVGARKIINGLDKAASLASYAIIFYKALNP